MVCLHVNPVKVFSNGIIHRVAVKKYIHAYFRQREVGEVGAAAVVVAEVAVVEMVTTVTTVEPVAVAAAHHRHSRSDLAATRRCTRVCSRQQEPEAALVAVEAAMARQTVLEVVVAAHRQPSRVAAAIIPVAVVPVPVVEEERVAAVVRVPLAVVGPPQGMPLLVVAVAVVVRPAVQVAADPLR